MLSKNILLNIKIITLFNLIAATVHYFIQIIILNSSPTKLPWPVEIIVFIGFSYLMVRVVNEGENSLQRFFGYFGAYMIGSVFTVSIISYTLF